MHTVKISVAICTYNRSEQLKKCVQSIIYQEAHLLELIIVYHSKSDLQGVNMLKKDVRIRFFHCNKPSSSASRNVAINNSKGAILAFIDDDCIANRYWLLHISQHFKNPHSQLVMGRAITGSKPNVFSKIENARINHYVQSYIVRKGNRKYATILDTKNFAVRKSFLIKHNLLFDTRFTDKFEDIDFGLRVISVGASISYNSQLVVRHFGTPDFCSHVKREFSIGYNYCAMEKKWSNKLNMKVAKILYFAARKTGPLPKSYILIEWVDVLFRFFGSLKFKFKVGD